MDEDTKTNDDLELLGVGGGGGGAEEAVRVFVRIRPLNKREIAEKQQIGWNYNETSMIEDTQNGQRVYAYDCCFGPNSANREVYEIVGKPVVLKAMEGYNGTVFTYGQTGSGKTWTMRGSENDPGMMILCIRDIMEWMETHSTQQYTLRVSYLEVYNEEINDLLGEGRNLRIVSEDAAKGAVIGGLVEELVKSPQDFMTVLQRGEASRSYASTSMNDQSSRSHTIYRVAIEITDAEGDDGDIDPISGMSSFGGKGNSGPMSRTSYLNLVDLAGSERQKQTNTTGKTLKEGANINKSLLALGAVINKLGEACSSQGKQKAKGAKAVFIPYRDSKLTRILKQSLGGNTLTSILCAVTPAPMHREETVSTLKFGQLCKTIKNSVKSNELMDDKALMRQYRTMINELKSQVEELQGTGGEMAIKEKAILISRVRAYENIIITNNLALPDPAEIAEAAEYDPTAAGASVDLSSYGISAGGDGASHHLLSKMLKDAKEESARQNEKMGELQRRLITLQRQSDERHEFEEAKSAFEEYEQQVRQELDDEKSKIEAERTNIHTEKYKLLTDRTNIEEKEGRLGLLTANLDERDSKLRQLLSTMKEQQEQWNRSIQDLQRREDLVEEWQRSHRQRETRLQEIHQQHEEKFQELNNRERDLSEFDQKLQLQQRELSEREQRLQVAMSRVANSEQALTSHEEKLHQQEANLKKREGDCDIKERELQIRRREMESWDSLLREKDRKISAEQRALDEREENIRSTEEKIRHREADIERKLVDVRQSEALIQELRESYNSNLAQLESREKAYQVKSSKMQAFESDLSVRESNLNSWESALQQMQYRLQGIEEREAELKIKMETHKRIEEEFFNVKVAQITARHSKEMGQLEQMLQQQLKIVGNFQADLTKAREELLFRCQERDNLKTLVEDRDALVAQLKYELQTATTENQAFANSLISGNSGSSPAVKKGGGMLGGLEENKSSTPLPAKSGDITGRPLLAVKPTSGVVTATNVRLVDPLSAAEGQFDSAGSGESSEDEDFVNGNAATGIHEAAQTDNVTTSGSHAQQGRSRRTSKTKTSQGTTTTAAGNGGLRINSSPDFLMQLADAQRLIHQILVNHNALPSEHEPFYRNSLKRPPFNATTTTDRSPSPENANAFAVQHMQQLFNQFAGRPLQSPTLSSSGNPLFSPVTAGGGINSAGVLGGGAASGSRRPSVTTTSGAIVGVSRRNSDATNFMAAAANATTAASTSQTMGHLSDPENPANGTTGASRRSSLSSKQLQTQIQTPIQSQPQTAVSAASAGSFASPTSIRGILRHGSVSSVLSTNTASNHPVPEDDLVPQSPRMNSPQPQSQSQSQNKHQSSRKTSPHRSHSPHHNHGSPDLTGLVERGERDGIPVTTVSLQFASTRKLVNQVIRTNSPPPASSMQLSKQQQQQHMRHHSMGPTVKKRSQMD